ncbi:hypothetical protein F4820DRAFT_440799 [Hypoxylon rubiginosum]|uniref:Uncharacterized protein n=1 Tax=Hypoxylon rubiginosum TaxID=110542 RepID=A0ACB9YI76_9PEZI|nr:hypothetical protein F4820DRAFT_440799 [Hypoxylon rubiginosum]
MEHAATLDSEAQPSSSPPPPWTPSDVDRSFSGTELTIPDDHDETQDLLVLQRKSKPDHRPPETKRRYIFRSKKYKELKSNENNWQFNKHEVAEAFNSLLAQNPLPRCGLAKALLHRIQPTSIDELWCHLHDPKLESKMKRRFGRRSTGEPIPLITWLDTVTLQGNVDYIQLLCETRLGVDPINRAFGLALQSGLSSAGIEILLSFSRITSESMSGGKMLLSYSSCYPTPEAMTVESWRYCVYTS